VASTVPSQRWSQEGPGARRGRGRVPRPGAAEELLVQRSGGGGAAAGCQSHGEGLQGLQGLGRSQQDPKKGRTGLVG